MRPVEFGPGYARSGRDGRGAQCGCTGAPSWLRKPSSLVRFIFRDDLSIDTRVSPVFSERIRRAPADWIIAPAGHGQAG
jgi:hypothetical protein